MYHFRQVPIYPEYLVHIRPIHCIQPQYPQTHVLKTLRLVSQDLSPSVYQAFARNGMLYTRRLDKKQRKEARGCCPSYPRPYRISRFSKALESSRTQEGMTYRNTKSLQNPTTSTRQ